MGFLWQSFLVRRRGAVCLGVVGMMCAGSVLAVKAKADAWQAAVEARTSFEAEPAGEHTKAEYSAVMDDFRAIYHGNPGDAHAARAIEQVAELLAEQGRELNDKKSLRDAAGQYEFLAKAYPGGAMASGALGHALELLGPDGAADQAEAYQVELRLRTEYPRSVAAREIGSRAQGSGASVADAAPVVKPAVRRRAVPSAAPVSDAAANDVPAPIVRRGAGDDGTAAASSAAAVVPVVEDKPVGRRMASVSGIRHWSTPTYTRVAIDLGDEVEYQAARVENPDRIYFDLHHARLAQELVGKSFAITDDGFLTKIRAAQFSNDVTRVVLDVHEVGEYSAFLLPNPYRLIIDIHGKQQGPGSRAQGSEGSGADRPVVAENPLPQTPSASGPVEVSALPPMPVTDGSEAFGLPKKTTNQNQAQAVAQPRVVIPVKSTMAKPVPNSVTSRSVDTGVEVAAVSQQQGRVEATSRPTSQPIVARSSEQGTGNSEQTADDAPVVVKKGSRKSRPTVVAHVDGAPVEAAPPTADGETSLVRALGLKIGRIVIDAGHGGHDSGTLGAGGIEEKDVVLDVALRLGKLLHDRLGAEIVYTRADDTFIPLETRTAIANKAQADLFISIHANSSSDASARGVEVYYLNFTSDPEAMRVAGRENAVSTQSVHELSDLVKKIALKDKIDESKELAGDVDESLFAGIEKGNAGLKNRGVKKAPFVVLIGANMPSILAEISFVTNPDDAEQLEKPAYRERVAESLYNGVARYAGGINGAKPSRPTEQAAR